MKLFNLLPKKSRFLSMSLTLLASATLLSSCLKNDSDTYEGPVSGLSFVHAASSQPTVNLFIDGRAIFNSAVQYGSFSQYLTAGSGNHLVQATLGGTTQKLTEATVALAEGKYHTVFIANKPSSDSLTTVMTTDDLTAPASGKAKVRFVQLSPDAVQEYDMYIQGGAMLFDAKAYRESTNFVEIDPAKYKFAARLAGTVEDKAVTGEVDVRAGGYYTIVVAGTAAGTGNAALKAFVVAQ